MSKPGWIVTYTGKKFWPLDPNPEDIDIVDIAHALSLICRWTGHCKFFFSVAQHSVMVADNCKEHALWGLLHDASEAYISDIARPVKVMPEMEAYRSAERVLQQAVCRRFGLDVNEPEEVRIADNRGLATEARDLMGDPRWPNLVEPYPVNIADMTSARAEQKFLETFYKLTA